MTDGQLAGLIGAATTLGAAFVGFLKWAFGQWLADRKEERAERREEFSAVVDIQLTLAAMLERDRVRDNRRKRETMQPTPAGRGRAPADSWEGDGEVTDVVEIKERLREAALQSRKPTPPAGARAPRPGAHHDEDR